MLPAAGDSTGDGPAGAPPRFHAVRLAAHRNNRAISTAADTRAGAFNVWGNSFAAEHLPAGDTPVLVGGVPYDFPPVGSPGPDNVRCDGQFIALPAGRYDWLHLLVASERRTEDTVWLHFADTAVEPEWLRVSDFWAAPAWFGEVAAFRTPVMHYPHHIQEGVPACMWSQRVPVSRRGTLTGVRLPRNIAVHVFAATLQTSGEL